MAGSDTTWWLREKRQHLAFIGSAALRFPQLTSLNNGHYSEAASTLCRAPISYSTVKMPILGTLSMANVATLLWKILFTPLMAAGGFARRSWSQIWDAPGKRRNRHPVAGTRKLVLCWTGWGRQTLGARIVGRRRRRQQRQHGGGNVPGYKCGCIGKAVGFGPWSVMISFDMILAGAIGTLLMNYGPRAEHFVGYSMIR